MARIGIGCLVQTINLAVSSATSFGQVADLLSKQIKGVGTFRRNPLATKVLEKSKHYCCQANSTN